MAGEKQYDVVVVGSGPGGYVCAIRAAQLGLSTALVEKEATLGGTCLNIGCIPSKALLDSSERYLQITNQASEHGIEVSEVQLDLTAMMKRKDNVVRKLTAGLTSLMKHNNVTVLQGTGTIPSPGVVEVNSADAGEKRTFTTAATVLATGSVPAELPFMPFDGKRIVSSTEALAFKNTPGRLLVIGAGAIGLELGSVWARLGSEVEVLEIMPRIMPEFDTESAKLLQKELTRQGLRFHLDTEVTDAEVTKSGVTVTAVTGGRKQRLEADVVLVAVGRRPYTEGLDLDALGIERLAGGERLRVDERYRTTVEGIYAIGDLIHGPMLAHKAEEEGVAAAERIAGFPGHVSYDAIPNVVYTFPEAAAVGYDEDRLKREGVSYRVGRFPFGANGRALAMGAPAGMAKIIAEPDSDRVLGAHIVGPWASDLITEVVTVIEFGGSAEDIARICHAHPSLSETVKEAALSVAGRALHST